MMKTQKKGTRQQFLASLRPPNSVQEQETALGINMARDTLALRVLASVVAVAVLAHTAVGDDYCRAISFGGGGDRGGNVQADVWRDMECGRASGAVRFVLRPQSYTICV